MKRCLLILSLLILGLSPIMAGDRTEQQMKESAAKVLSNNSVRRAANNSELKELLSLAKLKIYGYDEGGFAIVTTDDRFEDVIGYSSSRFSENIPCGFKWWMESVEEIMEKTSGQTFTTQRQAKNRASGVSIAPLMTTTWGQERPYNDNCTFTNDGDTYQCVTGCVATALAQVMNYYKYPERGTGSFSYDITYNNSFKITFSEDFSQSVYDWGNMLDDYNSYWNTTTKDDHTKAVAKLMKDCGVATRTRYSNNTHGSSASLQRAEEALKTYFYYDESTKYYSRSDYGKTEWMNMIYGEIDKGRPVLYCGAEGESINSAGHAFVLNGYDSSGNVYINWGWDGYFDGYFDIDMLNPDNDNYNYRQAMIIAKPGNNPPTPNFYSFNISAQGSGTVYYGGMDGAQIKNGTQSYKVKEGNRIFLLFSPDSGNKIKSVKVNSIDVTSNISENSYTINSISEDTNVEVEFEVGQTDIDITQYISAACTGGSFSQTGNLITSGSKMNWRFSNNSTKNVTLNSMQLIDGETGNASNIMAVNTVVKANSSVSYVITLGADTHTPVTCRFKYTYNNIVYSIDAVYTGTTTSEYTLSIKASGNGQISYKGNAIRNTTKSYSVEMMSSATLTLMPDDGYQVKSVKVNGTDVTSNVSNNSYTINQITSNQSVEVEFEAIPPSIYHLTYMVDGEVYKSYEIEKGASITPEPAPTKEGYTFSGWSEIPKTMPANDVTITGKFTINKYKLTYMVDGSEYKTIEIEYGTTITPEVAPTKEGFAFSGWSNIPQTMPANDVTIIGTFTMSTYKLTYMLDGEVYKTVTYDFGATITPEAAPTKEGYSFSGWSEIPSTMPAKDITVTGSFTINKYKLVYMVDGIEYKSYDIEYGATITPEAEPTKEGYTFSGWGSIPATMPANDVTVTGSFTINKYKLSYMVDGTEYKSYDIEYGATITPEAEPTKEGYTFSGWSTIPVTMPAKAVTVTGTFTINKYKLVYMVDGTEYKSYDIEYGATITPEAEPTKEGYTFSGWSTIPETMPAKDVTITGTFTKGAYKLTYMVDEAVYKTVTYDFGTTITPEAAPTKEGYTFSGWSEIPVTMPANDVTVTGKFTINKYKLVYMVDGVEYKSYDIEYGATITPEAEPTKEGHTFSGWNSIPATMPANDITVTGSFTKGAYKLIYMVDGEVYKTVSYDYDSTITPEAEPTKEGYTFSGWSEIPSTMPAHDVKVTGTFTQVVYVIDDVTYEITGEGTITIKGSDQKGEVTISATIEINGQTYQVTAIGENAFKDNQSITSVTIPEGISTIGDNAFNGCIGLIVVNIGKDVKTIGNKAFANIGTASARTRNEESMLIVNCYTESVPYTASDAFENTPIETGTLYVVDNLKDSYKATSPWSGFGKIIGFEESTGINAITIGSGNAFIFDMQGNRLDNVRKGVNIIRTKDGKTKKVILR